MENSCRVCARPMLGDVSGVCQDCATKLGITPLPPSRRKAAPCQRCNTLRFIRVVPREHAAYGGDYVSSVAAPMTAALPPYVSTGFFGGTKVEQSHVVRGRGVLEMYICASCGFVEWYCQDPESIPIGPENMSEIVDYTPTEPYR